VAKYSTPDLLTFLERTFEAHAEDLKNLRELFFIRLVDIHRHSINSSRNGPTEEHKDRITSALNRIDNLLRTMNRGDN